MVISSRTVRFRVGRTTAMSARKTWICVRTAKSQTAMVGSAVSCCASTDVRRAPEQTIMLQDGAVVSEEWRLWQRHQTTDEGYSPNAEKVWRIVLCPHPSWSIQRPNDAASETGYDKVGQGVTNENACPCSHLFDANSAILTVVGMVNHLLFSRLSHARLA